MRLITVAVVTAFIAAVDFLPARRLDGDTPPLPSPQTVGWIDETVDVTVDTSGAVTDVTLLRGPRTGVGTTSSTIATWRFQPATDEKGPVRSHVLVTTLIRPPQTFDRAGLGEPASDLAPSNDELPYPAVIRR